MKKTASLFASAAIAASLAMSGAMSSFAAEDAAPGMPVSTNHCTEVEQFQIETVSIESVQFNADAPQTPTEAPTEAPTEVQTPTEAVTEAPAEVPVTYSISKEEAENQALIDAAKGGFDGIVKSSEYDAANGYWNIAVQRKEGTKIIYYHVGSGIFHFIDPEAENAAAVTTAAATTAKSAATTTASATKAAAKTADKNNSPKTGVEVPAASLAGLALAAATAVFAMKKREF